MSLQGLFLESSNNNCVNFNHGTIDFSNECPFIQGIAQRNIEKVSFILKCLPSEEEQRTLINKLSTHSNKFPLEIAAATGNLGMFNLLRDNGATVNSQLLFNLADSCPIPGMVTMAFGMLTPEAQKSFTTQKIPATVLLTKAVKSKNYLLLRAVWGLFPLPFRYSLLDLEKHTLLYMTVKHNSAEMIKAVLSLYTDVPYNILPCDNFNSLVSKIIEEFKTEDGDDLLSVAAASGDVAKLDYLSSLIPRNSDGRPVRFLFGWNNKREDIICAALRSNNPAMVRFVLQTSFSDFLIKHLNVQSVINAIKAASAEMKAIIREECVKKELQGIFDEKIGPLSQPNLPLATASSVKTAESIPASSPAVAKKSMPFTLSWTLSPQNQPRLVVVSSREPIAASEQPLQPVALAKQGRKRKHPVTDHEEVLQIASPTVNNNRQRQSAHPEEMESAKLIMSLTQPIIFSNGPAEREEQSQNLIKVGSAITEVTKENNNQSDGKEEVNGEEALSLQARSRPAK